MNKEDVIFDFTRKDYKYKGLLFAQQDNEEIERTDPSLYAFPKDFCVNILALIWEDEKGVWHTKIRFRFPSGNKQVASLHFDKEFNSGIKVNETYVLNRLYKAAMKNKIWCANPSQTGEGIVEILKNGHKVASSISIETQYP